MKSSIVFLVCFFLAVGFIELKAEEYNERAEQNEASMDEEIAPDTELERRAVGKKVAIYSDKTRKQGFCNWAFNVWLEPGTQKRCNCMKCACSGGGNWNCAYNFAYCPYYYCGNRIYNPQASICCCGKLYAKKASWKCCGYSFYNQATSKCCNYYTVKAKNGHCPRHKI